jgi:hypothetical protein
MPIIKIPDNISECFRYFRKIPEAPVPIRRRPGNVPRANAKSKSPPSRQPRAAIALAKAAKERPQGNSPIIRPIRKIPVICAYAQTPTEKLFDNPEFYRIDAADIHDGSLVNPSLDKPNQKRKPAAASEKITCIFANIKSGSEPIFTAIPANPAPSPPIRVPTDT